MRDDTKEAIQSAQEKYIWDLTPICLGKKIEYVEKRTTQHNECRNRSGNPGGCPQSFGKIPDNTAFQLSTYTSNVFLELGFNATTDS